MRVEVNMTVEKELFEVNHWWAKTPQFVIEALQKQLVAASAIWPELKHARVVEGSVATTLVEVLDEAK